MIAEDDAVDLVNRAMKIVMSVYTTTTHLPVETDLANLKDYEEVNLYYQLPVNGSLCDYWVVVHYNGTVIVSKLGQYGFTHRAHEISDVARYFI